MRAALLLLALALACDETDAVQGQLFYGTFSMSAKRESDGCGLKSDEAWSQVVTLSASPPRFYMRVGADDRVGTLEGARFTIDPLPVKQSIEECVCPAGHPGTQIQEHIEGELRYAMFDGGFPEDAGFAPADADAGLLPEGFAGAVVDTVSQPQEGCTCADAGPLPCAVRYTVTGLRQ